MINRSSVVSGDSRLNMRIPENKRVMWYLQESRRKGRARVRNISASGMMVESGSDFVPRQDSLFTFDTDLGEDNFIPRTAQLIWSKPCGVRGERHMCGFKFVNPSDYIATKLRQRVQGEIFRKSNKPIIRQSLEALFGLMLLCLTALTAWVGLTSFKDLSLSNEQLLESTAQQAVLTQSYSHRLYAAQLRLASTEHELSTTKTLYDEGQQMLGAVRQELAQTKSILAETEALVAQAQTQAAQAQAQAGALAEANLNEAQLARTRGEYQATIALLQEKNDQLSTELQQVKSRLDEFQNNVNTTQEARALLNLYRDKMRLVKEKIRHFQREAHQLRNAAGDERDRIQLALGNNGYLMKNGQSVEVDYERYHSVGHQLPTAPDVISGRQTVAIDVHIVD